MTGISSLFPAFPKQMSILDIVNITVARHKNEYFKKLDITATYIMKSIKNKIMFFGVFLLLKKCQFMLPFPVLQYTLTT